MMKWSRCFASSMVMTLVTLFSSAPARADMVTVHIGPPALGSGGANPVSIPPTNPLEYEVEYVTTRSYEMTFGITPGLFFGKRAMLGSSKSVYVSAGGGAVIDSNGQGPGGYFAMGWNYGGDSFKFNAEIKQAIGVDLSKMQLLNPYAIRIGLSYAY